MRSLTNHLAATFLATMYLALSGAGSSVSAAPITVDFSGNINTILIFYYELGGVFPSNKTGDQTADGIMLDNIHGSYWTGTQYATEYAWSFDFIDGSGGGGSPVWPVLPGDPAAVWTRSSPVLGSIVPKAGKPALPMGVM
jgi:hypothetical protein